MGNITCNICKTDAYKDNNNPVLTIHHSGRYNNYRICANCLGNTNMRISEKSSSIVLKDTNIILPKENDKDDKIYWLMI
jgi:superfamily II helicase